MEEIINTELENEKATVDFGALIAKACTEHSVIFLHGSLGAGKTTFCRGFIQSLGHVGKVKSPTYTLIEPYELADWRVYHFDLYRLADPEELEFMGIRDYFDLNTLCLIEWPEKGEGLLPKPDLEITLGYLNTKRTVQVIAKSEVGKAIIKKMECN